MVVTPVLSRGQTSRRRWLALLFFSLGTLALWFGVRHWSESSVSRSILQFGMGLGCYGLGVGIELAQEWARKICGSLGAILAVFFIWTTILIVVMDFARHPSLGELIFEAVCTLLFPGLWSAVAIYCFLPSTRSHFAEVRQAQARARAVPG